MKRITLFAFIVAAAVAGTGCKSAFTTEPVMKISAPPSATLAATTARPAELRTGPDGAAKVVGSLPAGAMVQASGDTVRGFRRVKTADGKSGYVEAAALTMGEAAAPAPAKPNG